MKSIEHFERMERNAKICIDRLLGTRVKDIAQMYGITTVRVYEILRDNGLNRR
jgi:Mor family transcriptional regulator